MKFTDLVVMVERVLKYDMHEFPIEQLQKKILPDVL